MKSYAKIKALLSSSFRYTLVKVNIYSTNVMLEAMKLPELSVECVVDW